MGQVKRMWEDKVEDVFTKFESDVFAARAKAINDLINLGCDPIDATDDIQNILGDL